MNQNPPTPSDAASTQTDATTGKVQVEFGKYKGSPTISFREGPDDRYPFTFGPAKARKLLTYAEEAGAAALIEALHKIAGRE